MPFHSHKCQFILDVRIHEISALLCRNHKHRRVTQKNYSGESLIGLSVIESNCFRDKKIWICICNILSPYDMIKAEAYTRGPFYSIVQILIPACISNFIPWQMCNEITYPVPNVNGCTVEVCEWICNFILRGQDVPGHSFSQCILMLWKEISLQLFDLNNLCCIDYRWVQINAKIPQFMSTTNIVSHTV